MNFIKYSPLYFVLSACFIIPSIISLFLFGLQPAIDFTGGSLLEIRLNTPDRPSESDLANSLSDIVDNPQIQSTNDSYIIRTPPISQETNTQIQTQLKQSYPELTEVRFETIGPTLGRELLQKTLFAVLLGIIVILSYIAYQFKSLKYGICAIIAMLHDTLIVIGAFSLLGHFIGIQVDTLFVTAILTVLSFSIHDTIVVYDRIRESLVQHPKSSFTALVDKSIAETLSRSINNSMTIIFMLTALFLLGGDTIRWFIFALLLGTITGTYSSTFTAAPLLVVWTKYFDRRS